MSVLMAVVAGLCGIGAVGLVVEMVRNRQPGGWLLDFLGLVSASVLVVTAWGVVRVFGDTGEVPVWEYLGYLLLVPFFIPAGIVWSHGDESRGGTAALLVAVLVVPFLFLRLHDIWAAGT